MTREEKFTDQKYLSISSLQNDYLNLDSSSGSSRNSEIEHANVIEGYAKNAIRKLLHANIDVHSRRLIAEFPKYGIKYIEKLQSYSANMNFSNKSRYDSNFQQVTHKGGESAINYIKRFQNAHTLSV